MQERDISIDDVGNCIMSGEIIEDYPDDFPHPSCLIFGYTINHKVWHTVVGSDGEILHIITARQLEKLVNTAKQLMQEVSVINYTKVA